jgi:hypothetical protein
MAWPTLPRAIADTARMKLGAGVAYLAEGGAAARRRMGSKGRTDAPRFAESNKARRT